MRKEVNLWRLTPARSFAASHAVTGFGLSLALVSSHDLQVDVHRMPYVAYSAQES